MEEMNQDTPPTLDVGMTVDERAFGAPVEAGSVDNGLTVAEAFSNSEEVNGTPAPVEGTPVAPVEAGQTGEAYEAKNDDRRFEYWQSQAARRENELSVLQQQLETAKAQPQAPAEVPAQQTQPEAQEFPPAPSKPEKPRAFSRDEAYSDPQSESAQYLDSVESWRDDMVQYSELKGQYEVAVLQERLDGQDKQRKEAQKRQKIQMDNNRQSQEVYEHVTGHYGFNDTDAREFIQTMSKPESITMDNLVNLYRMQKGQGTQAPAVNAGPSATFTQTQNAQSIPSPMGVVTGESGHDTRPEGDQVMDDLINSFNSKNPWG
tara:strand:- start:1600 stop:2553 length:954 start_codon:yes stop_codon:yes gene_type:complete